MQNVFLSFIKNTAYDADRVADWLQTYDLRKLGN